MIFNLKSTEDIMSKKSLFNKGLKLFSVLISMVSIISCSSNNSDEWPELHADNLWQELEETNPNDAKEAINDNVTNIASPSKPSFDDVVISLEEVKKELRDIEFLLPQREAAVSKALNEKNN